MAKEIVLIADDFGMSGEINAAILHAYRQGALQGASLMMGQPGTQAAIAMAQEHPSLQVGWHLHLADSRPCTGSAWPWGRSPFKAGLAIGVSRKTRERVRIEIQGQWDAYRKSGLACRFVNAHHHLHLHPVVRRILTETVHPDFNGWVRWGRPRFFGPNPFEVFYRALDLLLQSPQRSRLPFRLSTTLWGIDRTFNMKASEVLGVVPTLGEGLHEFMFHPRRVKGDPDTATLLELGNRSSEQA